MPQMAPLNWCTLMFFFIFILAMFSTINFYSFKYNTIKSTKNINKEIFNWKW